MELKFGWKRDKVDERDYLYKAIRPSEVRVPDKVDLRNLCSPIENQGYIGSCTASAIAGNLEFLENKERSRKCCLCQIFIPKATDISRLFVYYNERKLIGTVNEDSGAYLRDGMKTLNQDGWCTEKLWPYNSDKWSTEPTKQCYDDARQRTISTYNKLETEQDRIDCLATGYPFVFGIDIFKSFTSDPKSYREGIIPMPNPSTEQFLGGHAVCAVGYNKEESRFLCRNSWGEAWGDEGYFTIPFEYLKLYGADFWTIRK